MKKSIIKTVVLAALMALPMFAKAQTFAGITAEQNAQNTPEGWTAVELPQLPAITSANTFNIKDYGASTSAADNTKAIQKALDAVPTTGGMVVIPAGTWMFGSTDQMTPSKTEVLSIKAKTILHLSAGATLKLVEYGKAQTQRLSSSAERTRARTLPTLSSRVKVKLQSSTVRVHAGGSQERMAKHSILVQ